MVEIYFLGLFSSYVKELIVILIGIKEDLIFYFKIYVKNK